MRYSFYVETAAERVVWTNLSRAQAMSMYRSTQKAMPDNVIRCGWAEQP